MKMMKIVLLVWLCLSVLPAQCLCFSRGASTATCMDMKPGHISAQPQHTHTASAVTIHTSRTVYLPQHTLMVSVRSSRAFMGLLLHARSVVEDRVVGGKFTHHPPGTHTISCLSTADTVTHSDKLLKRNLSFTWRAPAQPSGDLRFYITVVHSYFVYWTRIHSAVVHDGTHKTRTGHNPGLQNGIISASPTSSAITLTHTSAHTHSEHSNTTHKLTSNFLTHTTLPQHHKHSHTDKHTSTHDPRNRVTQTQLYKTTHKQTHTPKGTKNLLHALTHTLSRPDNTYTPSHTQTHTATTPVTHTHTSSNIIPMSRSLTTPTPQTHTRSPTTACTSPGVTMVTLKMHTYSSHEYTPAPSQHTRSSNLLTHTSASTASPTTSSHTPSHTPTPTASHTLTHSSTVSHMPTVSHTPTHTPTASNTHTHTHTHMPTVSYTPTHTPTLSHLITHTRTGSYTPINTPLASNTPTHTLTMSHTLAPSSALHPKPSAALRRSVSDPVEPRDDPEVFVKPPDPEPHPESGTKTGGGVKAEPGARLVSQPVLLLALSLFLLVVLAVYVQRKHCIRRNGVSLSDSRQEGVGVRHVQECGELVQLRRIRENSLLLLQAQYDIITAPGN